MFLSKMAVTGAAARHGRSVVCPVPAGLELSGASEGLAGGHTWVDVLIRSSPKVPAQAVNQPGQPRKLHVDLLEDPPGADPTRK